MTESRIESYRVRKVSLYYYLEDDTISIHEDKVTNSGLPSGTILKRHRNDSVDLGVLRVDSSVEIFGRKYHLCDADKFTRGHYESLGSPQPDSLPFPEDSFGKSANVPKTRDLTDFVPLSRNGKPVDSAKTIQFLANDGKVCRFFATCISENRNFIILYYLADDTFEIRETFSANCGYDNCTVYFKRSRVAEISLSKFRVGEDIELVYRKFLINDADIFTREYFIKKLMVTLRPPEQEQNESYNAKHSPAAVPPYTGFGSWDDSLGSVTSLNPKPPKRDLMKLYSNEGKILRFFARFTNPCPEDSVRRFIITYYLADDHLMIFEPPIRNSGILGGKFLEKSVYMNSKTNALFKPEDFVVGENVEIVLTKFTIETCDEYTKKYMERSTGSSINESEIDTVAQKICEKLYQMMHLIHETFLKVDKNGKTVVTIDKFREILVRFGFLLTEDDSLRVMQRFDDGMKGFVSYEEFLKIVTEWAEGKRIHKNESRASLEEYRTITRKALDVSNEADVTKRSLLQITDLLHTREGFDKRLITELFTLTKGNSSVNGSQICRAILNLGHEISAENMERCIQFYRSQGKGGSGTDNVDIVDFVGSLNLAYYKLET